MSATYAAAAEQKNESFDIQIDRSCDISVKYSKLEGDTVMKLLQLTGANRTDIQGISHYSNGSFELTFFERKTMLMFEKSCNDHKDEIQNFVSCIPYKPDNFYVRFKGIHIKISNNEFETLLERRYAKPLYSFVLKDSNGFTTDIRFAVFSPNVIKADTFTSFISVGGRKIHVSYKDQIQTCRYCNKAGHFQTRCDLYHKTLKTKLASNQELFNSALARNNIDREFPLLESKRDTSTQSGYAVPVNTANVSNVGEIEIENIQNISLVNKEETTEKVNDIDEDGFTLVSRRKSKKVTASNTRDSGSSESEEIPIVDDWALSVADGVFDNNPDEEDELQQTCDKRPHHSSSDYSLSHGTQTPAQSSTPKSPQPMKKTEAPRKKTKTDNTKQQSKAVVANKNSRQRIKASATKIIGTKDDLSQSAKDVRRKQLGLSTVNKNNL